MRIIGIFGFLALLNICNDINVLATDRVKGGKPGSIGGSKGDGNKGGKKERSTKGAGPAAKGGRKAPVKRRTLPNFQALSAGMDEENSKVGSFKGFFMEMPSRTRVLRVRTERGDECADYYSGLQNRQAASAWRLKQVLENLDYDVCEEPNEEYSFEEYYSEPVIQYQIHDDVDMQSLVCSFSTKNENRPHRTITVARTSKIGGTHLFRKMKKRIDPKKPDKEIQLRECLSMLDQFVRIQNKVAEKYASEAGLAVDNLMLDEIVGGMTSVEAKKKAEEEKEGSGLGAGYIVLIIFGVLVALGGGYYAFTKCSSNGRDSSRESKQEDIDRGEKRKRRSDKRQQDQRTVVQVVGRPVPI